MKQLAAALSIGFALVSVVAADVIELKTGERVEGTFKGADDASVRIEVGGQAVTFKPEQVRAIYYGNALGGAPPPSPGGEALRALKSLQSVTASGINYREYSRRVLDAKVVVDEFVRSPETGSGVLPVKIAMRYYELASTAWHYTNTDPVGGFVGLGQTFERDQELTACPGAKTLVERGRQEARRLGRSGIEQSRVIGIEIGGGLPVLWSCASDKIAEAEKLLAGEKK